MMRAGRLRHRIRIIMPSESQDSDGSVIEGLPVFALEAWASIEPLQGREYVAAQAIQADVTHRIRMRHMAGLRPKMQVIFGERAFDILSVLNINERNVELQLMCREQM